MTKEEKVEALLSNDRELYFNGVAAAVDDYEDVMRGNRKPYASMTDEELDAELKAQKEADPGGSEGGG